MLFSLDKCRVEIIRINTPIDKWYKAQAIKPKAVLNASLYHFDTRQPIGTIIEGGRMVKDSGNGHGIGVLPGVPFAFGGPWSAPWHEYLTSFGGWIDGGIVVNPSFTDPVVTGKHVRIGIGWRKDALTVKTSETAVTLYQWLLEARAEGFVQFVNLDGGGSRHLIVDGKTVLSSTRTPYNIIAIYGSGATVPTAPKGGNTVKAKCIVKTQVYLENGKVESGRRIDPGDVCDITLEVNSNLVVPISYPSGSTTRKAWIKDLANFQLA